VATAAVLARLGEVDASVVVSNPGGDLVVHLDRTSARLAGPVRFVGTMTWDAP